MRLTRALTVVLAVLSGSAPAAISQANGAETITIGPATIRLGMSREAVDRLLGDTYVLDRSNGLVRTKAGPPFDFLGTVGFDSQGRVDWVTRDWGPADQRAGIELAESLFGALAQITSPTPTGRRSCSDCRIEMVDSPQPRGSTKTIFIYRPGSVRIVKLEILKVQLPNDPGPVQAATVTEQLGVR